MKFSKKEWIFFFIVFIILFLIFIIVWNFININHYQYRESFENNNHDTEFYTVEQNASHQLGNYLSCYFYNVGLAFLHGKNFQTKINKYENMFTNYFPEKIMFDKTVQDKFISVGITDEILKQILDEIDGDCMSAWTIVNKEMEIFWSIMKPTINRILKEALEKSGLDKPVDAPVIHFRCSDMPFGKLEYYHFQKYSYFKDSLDTIQRKTGKKYEKVYICYCNSHNTYKNQQDSCDKYMKSLTEYLENLGYEVIIKCESINKDFAMMFYTPGLISTSSSFSFMAGFFSDGVFITSIYDERKNRECNDCGDWYKKGYTLKHSDVQDYHDTDKVIAMLK